MKKGILLLVIVGFIILVGGIVLSNRQSPDVAVGPDDAAADTAGSANALSSSSSPSLAEAPLQSNDSFAQLALDDMRNIETRMNRLFQRTLDKFPEIRDSKLDSIDIVHADVRDQGDHYLVTIDLPGVNRADIDARVYGNVLHLSAEREANVEEKKNDYLLRERSFGEVTRAIELPGRATAQGSKAQYKDGVLTLTLMKDTSNTENSNRITVE